MRRLTRTTRRDERGVTAVMVGLMATMLLAAAGLGIDTAHVAYDDSRVQHGADSAAVAIAIDCALRKGTCTKAGADGLAGGYVLDNAGGGTGSITAGSLAPTDGTVTVSAAKTVGVDFFRAFGISSKGVSGRATAIWSRKVTAATVLPFAASICEYAKVAANVPTTIRTDVNDSVQGLKKADKESILGPGTGNLDLLTTCNRPVDVPSTQIPTATVGVLKGGLWIPKTDGSNAYCDGKIHPEVFEVQTHIAGKNANCIANKWGPELDKAVGGELLLAVYAPARNYAYAGVASDPAAKVGTGDANISDQNGDFLIKIIGFAPFHLNGYCLEGTSRCRGSFTGANRLDGYFTGSVKEFDDAEYGTNGANLGAVRVQLVG